MFSLRAEIDTRKKYHVSYISIMESHRKKILYIVTKSNMGGAQRYVFEIATSLDPATYEVVVAFGGNGLLKST